MIKVEINYNQDMIEVVDNFAKNNNFDVVSNYSKTLPTFTNKQTHYTKYHDWEHDINNNIQDPLVVESMYNLQENIIEYLKNEYLPIRFKSKEINDYNAEDVEFKVKKYELLIFPSNLYHQVPPNKSDKLRISLAFNSYINGTISNEDTLYGLKL